MNFTYILLNAITQNCDNLSMKYCLRNRQSFYKMSYSSVKITDTEVINLNFQWWDEILINEIPCSHGSEYEDDSLLGYCIM
jgi:hypothetical protein